ncbi:helix-turn-helix transcriptional regulator [Crossiella sp. SN42]|uniref:helix-turn-helix domain-containing protein n=1 Tax=Crossiella sp. SN42 TaxID=2944808 RepID=UPI00207D5674|nr:helix-turn-helix transcriptional regulator [Crossiella sp. SN42]MCO1580529.1 helix-turn-helix transcriptional regulator [Crossiella sp. SN42]
MPARTGINVSVCAAIRANRQRLGLTQSALARRSRLARSTIRTAEHPPPGWRPTHRVAVALINALDLPAEVAAALLGAARPPPGRQGSGPGLSGVDSSEPHDRG